MFNNIKKLFLVDGFLFMLGGSVVIFASTPERGLIDIYPPLSILALEDTRKWLATQFLTVGFLLFIFSKDIVSNQARKLAARFRSLSLSLMFGVHLYMLINGRWVASFIYLPMIVFTILFIPYFYFGFIKTDHTQGKL